MDTLKNKSYKSFDYISRYTSFPYYYNTLNDKYIYGITSHISKNVSYTIHKVRDYDTLDLLANSYYGRPDLYWIIADFNDISDPFTNISEKFESIKIPSLGGIYFNKNE